MDPCSYWEWSSNYTGTPCPSATPILFAFEYNFNLNSENWMIENIIFVYYPTAWILRVWIFLFVFFVFFLFVDWLFGWLWGLPVGTQSPQEKDSKKTVQFASIILKQRWFRYGLGIRDENTLKKYRTTFWW